MLLPEKLQSWEYYKNKLPLFLQQSFGFLSHFRIWYDLLKGYEDNGGILGAGETILELLNIFDDDILSKIRSLSGAGEGEDTYTDLLDKIAALFAVSRDVICTWAESGTEITETLHLNDEELLTLIKGRIITMYCDGTFDQQIEYYNAAGLKVIIVTDDQPANVRIYLVDGGEKKYSDNTKKLFKSGLLRITNIGIGYQTLITDLTNILIWDSSTNGERWDEGRWTI